jgi:FRG domain-containing protein
MDEIRVSTWTELHEELFAGAWHEQARRHRSDYAFRGRGDAAQDLSTSLARLGRTAPELETHMLRAFRKYAASDAVPVDSEWNWLALGQHHGLPTRLLDWTYSPYVALHFATATPDYYDRDAVVWMVDYVRAHELVPKPLRDALDAEGANVFTTEMLAEVAGGLDGLPDQGDYVLFVEPPSFDERIVNQYALFSLMSDPERNLAEWIDDHPELGRKIVLPAELKWEVRDKLDQANITERVLFPGLDGVSRWLARYYAPREP